VCPQFTLALAFWPSVSINLFLERERERERESSGTQNLEALTLSEYGREIITEPHHVGNQLMQTGMIHLQTNQFIPIKLAALILKMRRSTFIHLYDQKVVT
jgi:hypothetical protein